MSGIDEQKYTELDVRMFFKLEDLQKVLVEGDFQTGDVLFIDEEDGTVAYSTTLENLKKFARAEKVIIAHSMGFLEELVKMIRRIGVKAFFEDWLAK